MSAPAGRLVMRPPTCGAIDYGTEDAGRSWPPLYWMNQSFSNVFMKKFTRAGVQRLFGPAGCCARDVGQLSAAVSPIGHLCVPVSPYTDPMKRRITVGRAPKGAAGLERIRHLEEQLAPTAVNSHQYRRLRAAIRIETDAYRKSLDFEQATATHDRKP